VNPSFALQENILNEILYELVRCAAASHLKILRPCNNSYIYIYLISIKYQMCIDRLLVASNIF
jgi:hypothetical protein